MEYFNKWDLTAKNPALNMFGIRLTKFIHDNKDNMDIIVGRTTLKTVLTHCLDVFVQIKNYSDIEIIEYCINTNKLLLNIHTLIPIRQIEKI